MLAVLGVSVLRLSNKELPASDTEPDLESGNVTFLHM